MCGHCLDKVDLRLRYRHQPLDQHLPRLLPGWLGRHHRGNRGREQYRQGRRRVLLLELQDLSLLRLDLHQDLTILLRLEIQDPITLLLQRRHRSPVSAPFASLENKLK